MAVALDNNPASNSITAAAVTSLDFTGLTVGSGSNKALVALFSYNTGITNISITWDPSGANQALTRIQTVTTIDNVFVTEVWGLVNPTSGNKTLRASWTTAAQAWLSAISFTGVDQTGGVTTFNNSTTNTSAGSQVTITATITVTTTTNDAVVASFAEVNGSIASVSNTQIFIDSSTNETAGNFEINGTTPQTLTATINTFCGGADWAVAATNVKAAAGGGGTPSVTFGILGLASSEW